MSKLSLSKKEDKEESWISVSDIMAGLMMVFLLIMILYARNADERLQNAQEIVVEWRDNELEIYEALYNEFKGDLNRWGAEIDKKSLTIRFLSPEILFQTGQANLEIDLNKFLMNSFQDMLTYFNLNTLTKLMKYELKAIHHRTGKIWMRLMLL